MMDLVEVRAKLRNVSLENLWRLMNLMGVMCIQRAGRGVDWKWKDQDDGSELMELSRGHLSTRLAPKLPGGAT